MNKLRIVEQLISQQELLQKELKEKIATTFTLVDIDEESTHDPEDFSFQFESGEMVQLLRVQLNRATGNIEKLKNLDISDKAKACPGAIVETENFNFLIGYPALPFDYEGKQIVGISCESPIYAMMVGKKKGDQFSYEGNQYSIINII